MKQKPLKLPEPHLDETAEREIWQMMEKGFAANRWRDDYEEWTQKRLWAERHQGRILETLRRWTGPLEGKRVLDLGTGRGGLSVALQLAGARVTAVDLRRRNCRILQLRGRRYGLGMEAAQCVGERLPFRSSNFDLVICKDVTEHCQDPERLLSEIARVLHPEGQAYVTFINRLAWVDPHYKLRGVNFLPRFLAEFVIGRRGRSKANIRDLQRLSDMHYYTLAGARRLAERHGFSYYDVSWQRLLRSGAGSLRRAGHRLFSLGAGTWEAVLRREKSTAPPES